MAAIKDLRGILLPCALALYILGSSAGLLHASQNGQIEGRVNMQGSIIDSPCTIATEDLYQSIEMAEVTAGFIRLNGRSQPQPFFLNLVNCDLDSRTKPLVENPHFSITFDGASEDGLFLLSGVSGVGLQVADAAGNVAIPGQPMPNGMYQADSQRLEYTLRLVRNNHPLKTGDYYAIFRFNVNYF